MIINSQYCEFIICFTLISTVSSSISLKSSINAVLVMKVDKPIFDKTKGRDLDYDPIWINFSDIYLISLMLVKFNLSQTSSKSIFH